MDVVSIINDVYSAGPGLTPRIVMLKDKYPDFAKTYPLLTKMISKPRFNIDLFNIVMTKRCKRNKRSRDVFEDDIESIPEIKAMFERQLTKIDYII